MMEQTINITGLSRDLIIHPGETLDEILQDRSMSQKELAVRTGVTEKHISTVLHGQKNISPAFARKLEFALGIEAAFWMNLQSNYDREILEFEELYNISKDEIKVLDKLKDVLKCWNKFGWIDIKTSKPLQVLDMRMLLGMSNLLNITKMSYNVAFRTTKVNKVEPYVLFAWQRMCELLTNDINVKSELDLEKLRNNILLIKDVMFLKIGQIQDKLSEIFAECGIAFKIVPNFKGAPVQGFIKETENGRMILCMTLRYKYADVFWFTLFHEIAHILNGDTKNLFIDFDSISNDVENKANIMAADFLINRKDYLEFVEMGKYNTQTGIKQFAKEQGVKDHIVLGRLMKDEIIPWGERLKYEWAE